MTDSAVPIASNRVSINAIAQTGGRILYLLTRLGIPPLVLHYVSLEEFGIWGACWIIISYVGMGAFGVTNVYVRFIARYNARNELYKVGRLLAAGIALTVPFSFIALSILWFCLPTLFESFSVPVDLQSTARILILGSVSVMLLDLTLGAYSYVLHGIQRIAEHTVVWILSYVLETVLIVWMLTSGWGITSMLYAFAIRYAFSIGLYTWMSYHYIQSLKLDFRGIDRNLLKIFFSYGGALQVSGMMTQVLNCSERLIAGIIDGLGSMALIEVGQKFPVMAQQMFSTITVSLLPAMSHLHSQNRHDEVPPLFFSASRYLNFLNGWVMAFLSGFAVPVLALWLGDSERFDGAATVLVCAALGVQFQSITGPASAYFQGINRPKAPLINQFSQVVALAIGITMLDHQSSLSLVDIVVVVMAARIFGSLLFLGYSLYHMKVNVFQYFNRVLLPGFLPYLWAFAIMQAVQPWTNAALDHRIQLLGVLFVLGSGYSLFILAFTYCFLCNGEEQTEISAKIKHTFRASCAKFAR